MDCRRRVLAVARRGDGRRDAAGALSASRDPQKALTSPHRSVGCSIPASGNPPLFLSDYGVFQEELRANFGPYDVVGTAEHDLENLTMSDSHRVARYVT